MISILVISRCAAPPYPAAPDFLHGKGGGASHKRGIAFPTPDRAVVKVFAAKGGIRNGAEGAVPRQRSDTI